MHFDFLHIRESAFTSAVDTLDVHEYVPILEVDLSGTVWLPSAKACTVNSTAGALAKWGAFLGRHTCGSAAMQRISRIACCGKRRWR